MKTAPAPIRLGIYLIGAFIVLNIVVLLLILVNQQAVREAAVGMYHLQRETPEKIHYLTNYIIYGGAAVHVLLSLFGGFLGVKLLEGKTWARARITALMIISAVISFYMFSHLLAGTVELAVHIVSDCIKLAIVLVLWLPASSRAFLQRSR